MRISSDIKTRMAKLTNLRLTCSDNAESPQRHRRSESLKEDVSRLENVLDSRNARRSGELRVSCGEVVDEGIIAS